MVEIVTIDMKFVITACFPSCSGINCTIFIDEILACNTGWLPQNYPWIQLVMKGCSDSLILSIFSVEETFIQESRFDHFIVNFADT